MGRGKRRTGSEAGLYLRLIDLVYHSTLGLRVLREKKKIGAARVVRNRRGGPPADLLLIGRWTGSKMQRIDRTEPEALKSITLKARPYRGTSLIRNSAPLGPYSRNMPRALWWSYGGGLFLMSEVPL